MMKIPVAKPFLDEADAQNAYDTILSGWVTQGPRVAAFEDKFAAYTGSQYAVAVSSCTAALHLALVVSGIGPGDEVICPSMSYIATANSIRYTGATVVFAEIDPLTYNLDIADVRNKITPRTKAVLLVHQLGMPADIDAFFALCHEHGLQLIEDAACAVGSSYKGKKIGSHSSLVCFSFHPRKVITTGDGGMITTDNEAFRDRLKRLRQHAMTVNDRIRHESDKLIMEDHDELGYNYRMTDIQASIGIRQLEKLDEIVAGRQKIAEHYLAAFHDIPNIRLPIEPEDCSSNFQSFRIYLEPGCRKNRNDLMQALLDRGISSRRGVMTAHRETAYHDYSPELSLPVSEDAADRSIIIPLYYPMSDVEINYVMEQVRNLLI